MVPRNYSLLSYGRRWRTANEFQFTNDFEPVLKNFINEILHNARKNDKIYQVRASISDTSDIVIQNIDTILERGEKLEVLVEKSEDLK